MADRNVKIEVRERFGRERTTWDVMIRIPNECFGSLDETNDLAKLLGQHDGVEHTGSGFSFVESVRDLDFDVLKTDLHLLVDTVKGRFPAAVVEYKLKN